MFEQFEFYNDYYVMYRLEFHKYDAWLQVVRGQQKARRKQSIHAFENDIGN
jgi:hypothetical protein